MGGFSESANSSVKPEVMNMAKKIAVTDSASGHIRDVGPAAARIDHAFVANALGAEDAGIALRTDVGPISSFQLRVELASRLHSSGGRPALKDAERRIKVPVTESQCRELEELAASLADLEFAPSAGQIASVLLSLSLRLAKDSPQLFRKEFRGTRLCDQRTGLNGLAHDNVTASRHQPSIIVVELPVQRLLVIQFRLQPDRVRQMSG